VDIVSVDVITPWVGRELAILGSVPLILACVGIMIHPVVRYGWRFAVSIAVTNVRNIVIILGVFLGTYAIFQWEFSLLTLMAMDCLAILVSGFGAVHALRAGRSGHD
jgi:preprotein translocase subunit SecF